MTAEKTITVGEVKIEVDTNRRGEIIAVGFFNPEEQCFLHIQDALQQGAFTMHAPTTLRGSDSNKKYIDEITTGIFGESKWGSCIEALEKSTLSVGWVYVCTLSYEDERNLFYKVIDNAQS